MTLDEALRRVRDPHEVLQLTDVELTEAAVTLAVEVERLRGIESQVQAFLHACDQAIDADPKGGGRGMTTRAAKLYFETEG